MDHRDFLLLAEQLIKGKTEAEWRSAVSRSYYAAFHEARILLGNCGFAVPYGDRAHKYLSMRLMNAGQADVKRAGQDLDTLRTQRNEADYQLRGRLIQKTGRANVQKASEIIRTLESVAADTVAKTQITTAMKTYERDVLKEVTWQP